MELLLATEPRSGRLIRRALRVLICSNDRSLVSRMKTVVSQTGHRSVEIDEGSRCVTLCEQETYDLILVDQQLNGLDCELTLLIIGEELKHRSVFLMIDREKPLQPYRSLKLTGVIFKPFDDELIVRLIASIDQRHELDRTILNQIANTSDELLVL